MGKIDVSRPLSVGEVARRSGVTVATVHFYEEKKLISGWRSAGNQRRYGRDVLRRIALVRVAQRAGIPLNEIGAALSELPEGRTPSAEDWRRLSAAWHARLKARILALNQLLGQMESCIGCGCLSLADCPLRNAGDHLAEKGNGALLLETPTVGAAGR